MNSHRTMLLLLVASIAAPALAATPPGEPGNAMRARGTELIERIDANRDGALARGEIDSAARERAQAIDRDRDGAVSVDELRAVREAHRSDRQARRLARIDGDHDGRVSVDEFAAFRSRVLMRLDIDGDGVLSPAEIASARASMRARRMRGRGT